MPRIPGYDQGSASFAVQTPIGVGTAEGEVQAMLGQAISETAMSLAQTIRYVQQKKARVYSNSSMSKLREFTAKTMIELRKEAGPGAEGYTARVLKEYDDFSKKLLEDSPNDFGTQDFTASSEEFRANVSIDSTQYEATASEAKTRFDVRDSAYVAANSLLTNPQWFTDIFMDQMMAFKAISDSLTPESEIEERFEIANSLAISAINGEIRLDPKTALSKLESGYWDTYEWEGQQDTLITPTQKLSFIENAKRASVKDNEVERFLMTERLRHHMVSLSETGTGVQGVNSDEIYRVFSNDGENPEKGEIAVLAYKFDSAVSRKVFGVKEGLKLASPGERGALIQRYKPRLGSPTFADDQRVYDQLIAWNQQDINLLNEDPAVWADKDGEVSDNAIEFGPLAGVELSLARQTYGGLPTHKMRVMPKQEASNIVSQLKAETPQNVLGLFAGYEEAYGPRFGNLVAELLDAGMDSNYITAYSVGKFNPAVAHDLVAALGVDEAALKNEFTVSRGAPWSSIEDAAQIVFQPYEQSQVRLARNRLPTVLETRNLFARAAALKYRTDSSRDIPEVISRMYADSLGAMLDVRDTYAMPRLSPSGSPIDTELRTRELERSVENESWVRQHGFDTAQHLSPMFIAQYGRWQNLSDNSGLRLVVERPLGVQPVMKDGREVVVTYEELAQGPWKDRWVPKVIEERSYSEREAEFLGVSP